MRCAVCGMDYGLSHHCSGIAPLLTAEETAPQWFFGGNRSYMGVMRPLLLGWFVNCLVLIPVAGTLAAAIAWTPVLMMVFEEVEGISRLQAFGISAGINVCFFLVQLLLTPVTRHL